MYLSTIMISYLHTHEVINKHTSYLGDYTYTYYIILHMVMERVQTAVYFGSVPVGSHNWARQLISCQLSAISTCSNC